VSPLRPVPSWRAQRQLHLNFTFQVRLLHYLFIFSLPFTPVYFLLAKCLRLPSVNFDHEVDTRHAARCSQSFPWHSMNVHPLVPLGVDIQLRDSNARLVVCAVHLTLRCVRCHHAGLVNSASVRNFLFFFFFFLVFFFGAITFVTSHYRAYS
jgi:hypothetical protein